MEHAAESPLQDITEHNAQPQTLLTRRQVVSKVSARKRIKPWMVAEVERRGTSAGIVTTAVSCFPDQFLGRNTTQYVKAWRWWNQHTDYLEITSVQKYAISVTTHRGPGVGVKPVRAKALQGCERKRVQRVNVIHDESLSEFNILREMGIKFNAGLLRQVALQVVDSGGMGLFSDTHDVETRQKIRDAVTVRWVYGFMNCFNIVVRKRSECRMRNSDHRVFTFRSRAFHLRCMQREYDEGILDEGMRENMDKTHFMINMDNGKTLGPIGDDSVNYADVVSRGEGINIVLRLSGGPHAKIETSILTFQNRNRNYPIEGVSDTTHGVCYRTGPKGWRYQKVMWQWLGKPRAVDRDPAGKTRVLWMDNCSGHNETPELYSALTEINADIRKLSPKSTHLCQPPNSCVIQKIKDTRREEWEAHKFELITNHEWSEGTRRIRKAENPQERHTFWSLLRES